ncbi:hypothetical protein HUG10_21265 (plasmid) [Halorarum halophilum]|uniref:Uncharacterized protein n=1 Tax=Halorarum halophilum TaxID=2743090 RepID=A0A7D5KAU9_9EURY|nr:hypothetical protein [Halobaculum halophilum]QLG30119.1 hypothetical protein HUG10_21265 [Halobaculum halophilum]
MEDEDPITLVELLSAEEETEFVIFNDGTEVQAYDTYGEAIDAVLETVGLEVGIVQGVDGGASRPVYLSAAGVIETLLEKIPDDANTDVEAVDE